MPIANSLQEFLNQVVPLYGRYVDENAWVYKQELGNARTWFTYNAQQAMENAYTVYLKSRAPALGMILLGDTKLRGNKEFVANFGFVADSQNPGLDDKESRDALQDIGRRPMKFGAPAWRPTGTLMSGVAWVAGLNPVTRAERKAAVLDRVKGMKGSILTANMWHPLLNDSLILGGAHGKVEMHFAASTDKEFRVARAADAAAGIADGRRYWQYFFHHSPETLWNEKDNVPRVLVRELLGLQRLGYEPEFSKHQLSFYPAGQTADLGHKQYLDCLLFKNYTSRMGMAGITQQGVKRVISEYLFGAPDLIRA